MGKSILIIDDEPDMLDSLEEAFHFLNYEVTRAKDGQQASEMLARQTPSIILSDYMMPRMNGCELFDWVRSSKNNSKTPFIFMSATPELITSIGTYAVLRKPFEFDALMSKVNLVTAL
jgi:DNA-binding response OmpR family regulator